MVREVNNKLSKKEQMKGSKKNDNKNLKRKQNKDSDDDNTIIDSEEDDDEMDMHEFRKYVQKIFPSKYLNKKIKAGEKLKNAIKDDENEEEWETASDEEDDEDEEDEPIIRKKSNKNKNKKKLVVSSDDDEEKPKKSKKQPKNKKHISDDEDSSEDEDYEDDEENEDDDDDLPSPKNKLNIIFTIGGNNEEDDYDSEYDDDYDSEYDDDVTEDEDESVSTDEDSEIEEDEDIEDKSNKKKNKKSPNNKKDKKKNKLLQDKEDKEVKEDKVNKEDNKKEPDETLEHLKSLLEKSPNDKSIKKCISVYESDIKKQKQKLVKKEKKTKAKNLRIFRKIMKDKNTMNDFSFYEKLETTEQKKIIKELREINKITRIEKPYRMTLLESTIPVQFKATAMKKINSLRYMEPGSGEFYKIKNWVDTFMRIPFNNYEGLPLTIEDGVEKCHDFMENAQKTLDSAVYGLNDAKMQIMQMLGQLLTNPKSIGTAIAIHGPPGTGKTSLVKEGISKILNRPFAFIALGGATDSSFLEGHSYTYEGSMWGKIVQILIDSKCMNPVIYFDELDKISETPRGEEIAGILTHLTDTSQNSQFHDKYFAEIDFDLSKCLFIFSYNDENKVNAILKDRMYRIKTKGYNQKEKTAITNNYLLPKIRDQVKFNDGEIIIPNTVICHIIENHCNKEDGVRNLKRCLEIIYTKLNLYRLMKPGSNLFESEMALKVEFPYTVTKDIVDKLIKKDTENFSALYSMYV